MLKVSELVETLIGEEPAAGFPCLLVRLTGCNLACSWCDTRAKISVGEDFTVDRLLEIASRVERRWILITGGEPLLQPECPALAERLVSAGFRVLIETNGTADISRLPKEVVKSVDDKTPSSGHAGTFLQGNLQHLSPEDAVKFVIADRGDFDWAIAEADSLGIWTRAQVVFSPVFGHLDPSLLAEWILEKSLPIRLSAQLHKLWRIP